MQIDNIVSDVTIKNWNRLKIDTHGKLTSRANKKLSSKMFIPNEYICKKENITLISNFITVLRNNEKDLGSIMYSLAQNLLKKEGILKKKHVQKVLEEFDFELIEDIRNLNLNIDGEKDLLGIIYQSLISEGKKNKNGSYYTPFRVAKEMTNELVFSSEQTFLDPCCGSGSFFLTLENVKPSQIYGIEKSYIPYMLSKINMLLKFKDESFEPQIFNYDFFEVFNSISSSNLVTKVLLPKTQFDYIITNPPWGGEVNEDYLKTLSAITSKESSSLFFVANYMLLKNNGTIKFLFPESILNVKKHSDLRKFILNNGNLKSIIVYENLFSEVITKFVNIEVRKENSKDNVIYKVDNSETLVNRLSFYETENLTFRLITEDNLQIIKKIKLNGKYYLDNSIWALGIVTGDNKNKLKDECLDGFEPIYTGKEIEDYKLKKAKKYIYYDRSDFQQVAKDEIYRAKEKLIYKFISNKLVFAYDDAGSLFLNSANILIPKIPNMSIKTVLAYLNSNVFKYYYKQLFGEIKILKGNLMKLPFPNITKIQNFEIETLVDRMIVGDDVNDEINDRVYNSFHLIPIEQKIIEEELQNGKLVK